MTQKQETPEQHAVRQEEAEEEARRESRRKALETQEIQRRETQAREAAAEERREAASQKAEELGRQRVAFEEQAQEQMNALNASLDELKALDNQHRQSLHAADALRGAAQYQDLGKALNQWVQGALLRNNPSTRARTLSEIDLLTPTPDTTARKPEPGLPGARVQDAPRQEANRFLATLHQRSVQLRRQYARDLAYGELVSPDEKDAVSRLSEEQRGQVQAMLSGENQ